MKKQPCLVTALLLFLALSTGVRAERIVLEAETASSQKMPFKVFLAGNATEKLIFEETSGGALEIPQGAGKPPEIVGSAELKFKVEQEGTYLFWARVWWTDKCRNSLNISLDGAKPFLFGEDATYRSWHWIKARTVTLKLTKGSHTLTLHNREDGIRLDQILLTDQVRYVPVGIEKRAR